MVRPSDLVKVFCLCREVVQEALQTCLTLFKIMVPILIVVKVIQELGWITYLSKPLAPVMSWVGLPPSLGLVWATAMINNIYGAIIVLVNLDLHGLSVAQMTVLGTMILVAHSLPVEVKIAQAAGTRFFFQLVLRILGAIVLGILLHCLYQHTGWLGQESTLLWKVGTVESGWWPWVKGQLFNLAGVLVIVTGLISVMRFLAFVKVIDLLNKICGPFLQFLGISKRAAPLTIVGMTMGLAYGGGLIIQEARSGRLSREDVFFSLSLLGLIHSMFEDTLLIMSLGGHVSGIFWGRLLFALVVVFGLVRLSRVLPIFWLDYLFFPVQAEQSSSRSS